MLFLLCGLVFVAVAILTCNKTVDVVSHNSLAHVHVIHLSQLSCPGSSVRRAAVSQAEDC